MLPLAIQFALYYSDAEKNIQNEMMRRLTQILQEKTDKINGNIVGAITLANKYNMNEELYKQLEMEYTDDIEFFISYQEQVQKMLHTDLANNQQVRTLTLYTNNPTVINGALVKKISAQDLVTLDEELLDIHFEDLSSAISGPKLRVSLVPLMLKTSYDRSLSIIRPLRYYPQYSKHQKILRIDLDTSYLSSILRDSDLFDNIILVDSENRIIASANTYSEFGTYDMFSEESVKKDIVVLKKPLSDLPLTLYGYYDTGIISNEFTKMKWKTIRVAFLSLLVAFLFIMLVAGNITKRIKVVVNQSRQIAKGNFSPVCQNGMGKDEIGVLADSINLMSQQLQDLIEEKYHTRLIKAQLERETAQAKLLALQSQVNPHFMFNALESIQLKAMVKSETETAKMIRYMSRMFRHLINWDEDIINLCDDIKFLSEFLTIQKYRFDEEFEYTIQVNEEANKCLLPKLIIQPLVENACIHGVEAVSHSRRVGVVAQIEKSKLIIIVSDNGGGIQNERLAKLKNMLAGGNKISDSVGLYNVYQRMVLYYGDEFTFDVSSNLGEGTIVRVAIPVRWSREEF